MLLETNMMRTCIAILVIFLVVPSVFSRHLDHAVTRGTSRRREDVRSDNSRVWQLTRTHLRLHAKPPKVLHVEEGDNEYLECQAGGTPAPVIHWLKDGKLLAQSAWDKKHTVNTSGNEELVDDRNFKMDISSTSSRLYLDCISAQHEAEYACIAENLYHRASTTTQVSVSSSEGRTCKDVETFGQAPRIYSWTKTMLENQGQDTVLRCRVDGHPKPSIEWLGPEEQLIVNVENNKYEILPSGDLIVRDLKWSDMGNYVCLGENIHGTARVEIFLYPAVPESKID